MLLSALRCGLRRGLEGTGRDRRWPKRQIPLGLEVLEPRQVPTTSMCAEAEPLLVQGYEGMKRREAKIPPQRDFT
jgi:hypothetical protein